MNSVVRWIVSAVLGPTGGFLVVVLFWSGALAQGHSSDFGPRSCVLEQAGSQATYDRLDARTESGGLNSWTRPASAIDREINILYWDIEASRSCMRSTDYRATTETFFDYNLRKLLARSSSAMASRFPDVLVLDNCTPCDRLDNMYITAARELKNTYRGNCEFIPRNEYRRMSGGTCLFWSSKVKMVPLSSDQMIDSNDRPVDWVPLRPAFKERERYRTNWIYRLAKMELAGHYRIQGRTRMEKKAEVDGLLLNRFAPRVFETLDGFRFHVIPARVNRLMGSPLDNVETETTLSNLVSRFRAWEPRDSESESMIHNQVGRLFEEYRSYVAKVKRIRRDRDVPIVLLGNLEIPQQVCSSFGGARKLQVLESLDKTSLSSVPSACDWPTSSTAERDLVHSRGRGLVPEHVSGIPGQFSYDPYLKMQLQHAYLEVLLGGAYPGSTILRSEVLPFSGTNIYPHSLTISY